MTRPRVRYVVRIPRPETHIAEVAMSVDRSEEGGVLLRMPAWTPGSYVVRDYSRHVAGVRARRVSGDEVPVTKVDKHTWRVAAKPGKRVEVSYEVYANELTVRTSHIDAEHAFLHSPGIFLYVVGREEAPSLITIEAPEGWSVSTALPLVGESTWRSEGLDHLVDSPIEVGDHRRLTFDVQGTPHRIALHGEGNFDREELLADTHAICRTAAEMFGEQHPSGAYTFIFHVLEGAAGGLEHRDCCVCGFPPHGFTPARSYTRQLSLIAHEYFHTWNVKRIRPRELGPFDYAKENYTRLLWLAEGFTTYYQWLILLRSDLATAPAYLDELAANIRTYLEMPGRLVEPVAEASLDAWIKLYRPHENTRNVTVSYYLKGSLVALLLDLTIREATGGERSLDDVMRALWGRYLARPEEGYDEAEVLEVLEEAAGRSLAPEIGAWVHGTEDLPFDDLLARFGLEFRPRDKGDEAPGPWLGIIKKEREGRTFVKEVLTGSPAYEGGLNSGDELVALNGWRLGKLGERLADLEPGSEAAFTVSRRGRLRTIAFPVGEAPPTDRILRPRDDAGDRQKTLFAGWLGAPLEEAAKPPPPPLKPRRPHPL